MADSNWEPLAEIFFHCSADPNTQRDKEKDIFCLCSRVLVKNYTEIEAIGQEELSEAYDTFNEQCSENQIDTMNRMTMANHVPDEEDSDANSCYYSATDSGADVSEYHGLASTSREMFKRSHRDESGASSSTDVDREHIEQFDEHEVNEQWDKYWSENCEQLIWTSWIEKYSDFINPEYQSIGEPNETNQVAEGVEAEVQATTTTPQTPEAVIEDTNEKLFGTASTEIIVSRCSPDQPSTSTSNEPNASDAPLLDTFDYLTIPRCDSITSSIPLTIGTTDSMTNVTQITLSSYGFSGSGANSSEDSQLSESTQSSLSLPYNGDEGDEQRPEISTDEDSSVQQWQVLWQQHYQEQYNTHYNEFIEAKKHRKLMSGRKSATESDDYEMDDLKELADLGLPTSFGSKSAVAQKQHTNSPKLTEAMSDRIKAAFMLMGFSYEEIDSADTITKGHVIYRKRNIRMHNNMLKMKKKRVECDNVVRDETQLNMIVDSSSDETDKPLTNGSATNKGDIVNTKESVEKVENVIALMDEASCYAEVPVEIVEKDAVGNDLGNDVHVMAPKNEAPVEILEDEVSKVTIAEDENTDPIEVESTENNADNAPKLNAKKSKKKRRQNKLLTNMPTEIANDRALFKYWTKRFSLFSLFDQGIKLDRESWFSVTPEKVAICTAMRCKCDTIIDAFCGAGGNSIQFAKTCKRVISIDIDEKKIEMARHNARIYGVEDRIEFVVGDYFEIAKTIKADVVFLSPPWGGISYIKNDVYDIEKSLLPLPASELMSFTRTITPNIAIYLPRNTNTRQVAMLAGAGNSVEVEQGFLDRKYIAITAYYGNLMKRNQT